MRASRGLLIAVAVSAVLFLAAVWAQDSTPTGGNETSLAELSGVLHKGEGTIMPYLVLDGSNERCYLRGRSLAAHEPGTRLFVRGSLRSELFDATGTDWRKPGAPALPPFVKGWVVYLDVKEAKAIAEPFGR
jgi:hypothetical protein